MGIEIDRRAKIWDRAVGPWRGLEQSSLIGSALRLKVATLHECMLYEAALTTSDRAQIKWVQVKPAGCNLGVL